ncbi:MAG: hypothetical protein ABSD11_14870 [Methylocella sp.]|jgi:hypothetical protein
MYQVPTRADFDRKLRALIQDARTTSEQERNRIGAELAASGLDKSGLAVDRIAKRLDEIHHETLDRALHLIHDFTNRMKLPATEITSWARPLLKNLGDSLLLGIPEVTVIPGLQQGTQGQYSLKFEQRLNDALRDIEIGFIGDRSMTVKDFDRRALVLRKLYDERHSDRFLPVPFDPSTVRGTGNHRQNMSAT